MDERVDPDPDNGEPVELVDERTATSQTFDNQDGSFTTTVFSHPVYYEAAQAGEWVPIDVSFEPASGDGLRASSDDAPVEVGVRTAGATDGYLSLKTDAGAVDIRLLGAVGPDDAVTPPVAGKAPATEGSVATYSAVLPEVDLQVHAGSDAVKSFLVLQSAAAPTSFAFAIDAPGMTLAQGADGGLDLVNGGGEVVARVPVPYVVDSTANESLGSGRFGDAVSLTLDNVGVEKALVLTVDPTWLTSAKYPVYVDPSITFSTTSESFDAFVSQAYPTMNFANYVRPDSPFYHEHWLGRDPSNSTNVNDVFLKFDLSPINDVTVDSATLEVFPYHQYYNAPTATNTWLNVVNGSWTEGGITWNNKPGSTWKTTEGLVEGQTGSFNLKTTVQSWVDGSVANNGVRLHESGENETYWKRLISSEEGGANKPALIVTYHRPTATPTSAGWKNSRSLAWTFSDSNGGHTQSHRQVQVSTSSTFSSILSDSGVDATASGSWSIPAGATLTNGTEYFWRVKVKDGSGWSTWANSQFIWDTSAPTGTLAINNGAAGTDTSTVGLALDAIDPSTTASYANNGRSLSSVVGCGSVVCNNAYPAPEFYDNKATGAIVAMANTGASTDWHTVTIDAGSPNRATIAMDVMRDSTTATYVGAVSDNDDGLRVELRATAGNDNLTTLAWTDTSTPQSYQTKAINLAFTPGIWYRLVMAASGTQAGGPWSVWWYPRDSAQPATPTEIVQIAYVPKLRLHAFFKGSEASPKALFIDNVEVVHNTAGGPYGSGATAVRFSPDNSTWGNWQGYADDLNYVLPTGSGTKNVYAQFRDAAGNTSSSASDSISVAFANLGRQSQHRFETWDLGAGDELAVNVENGNLVLTHPLVALPYRGGNSLNLTLIHNSQASDNVGLGPGWQLDLQRRLILNGDNTVTYVAADGARHTFTSPVTVGTVTTYTRPANLYATLVKDTSQGIEFTLTYRDQSRDRFDIAASLGRLASIEDRHGNAIALAYDGSGNLSTATDPASRQVTFTWDTAPTPDRLTSVADWAWIDGSGVVQTTATGSRRTYRFFFDGSGNLSGWSDPLNTAGTCPTNASHLTCLAYTGGQLTSVAKTQTYTTFSGGALGTATRVITTTIAYAGGRVAAVTDAESNATALVPDGSDRLIVARPTTTTAYNFQVTADPYARVANVWRQLDRLIEIEQRTTWDATYPVEPATVTDNYGAQEGAPARTVSFSYQASSLGLLTKLVDPLTTTDDRWTEHTYNANNDVTQTIVSLEGSGTQRTITRYCYDAGCNTTGNGLLLLKEIQNYIFGGATDDDTNVAVEYAYDAYGQRTEITRHNRDTSGATLDDRPDRYTYDADGNVTAEVINYANGTVTSPGDDVTPNTTTLARTDLTTAYIYDTAGNRVSTSDPRRSVELAKGTALSPDDFVTRRTYDALNRQLTERTPTTPGLASTQRTSSATYDELGGQRIAIDFGQLIAAIEFDRIGRSLRTYEDPNPPGAASTTSETTYDAEGRLLTSKDRGQVVDASQGLTTRSYDPLGRLLSTISAYGASSEAEDLQAYDGLGRRTRLEVGAGLTSGLVTTYGYDLGGRLTTVDDRFTCKTETFDYRDLVMETTSGLAGITCANATDTRVVAHTYDGLARMVRSEVTDGPGIGDRTADDEFDAAGNRRIARVWVGGTETETSFVINLLDQVSSEARGDGSTTKSTYDPAGNPTDACYWAPTAPVGACNPVGTTPWPSPPTTATSTAYDALSQRVALIDAAAASTTFYDPDHNYAVKAIYRATGSGREHQTLFQYDDRHRLRDPDPGDPAILYRTCTVDSNHNCSDTPVVLGSIRYEYDENDNRTQIVENNGATSSDRRYCYDALSQVIYRNTGAACSSSANDELWTYNDNGNRLSATTGGSTTYFAYDSSGLLCDAKTGAAGTCGGGNVTSDTAGRVKGWNNWTFSYDAAGRLISACKSVTCATGYDKVEFAYDGEGHRTLITATAAGGSTTTTEFRYQGDAVVEEKTNGVVARRFVTDESGAITKIIVPGTPDVVYLVNWNGHGDALNILRVNGDGTTTLANAFTYDSWGKPTVAVQPGFGDLGFRYLYVGQQGVQWDNQLGLDLFYMRARHYAPALGRFIQPDPARAESNPYVYAAPNPVAYSDPTGLAGFATRNGLCGRLYMWVIPQGGGRANIDVKVIAHEWIGFWMWTSWWGTWVNLRTGRGGSNFGSFPSWGSKATIRWHNVFTNTGSVYAYVSVLSYMMGRYPACYGSIGTSNWIY